MAPFHQGSASKIGQRSSRQIGSGPPNQHNHSSLGIERSGEVAGSLVAGNLDSGQLGQHPSWIALEIRKVHLKPEGDSIDLILSEIIAAREKKCTLSELVARFKILDWSIDALPECEEVERGTAELESLKSTLTEHEAEETQIQTRIDQHCYLTSTSPALLGDESFDVLDPEIASALQLIKERLAVIDPEALRAELETVTQKIVSLDERIHEQEMFILRWAGKCATSREIQGRLREDIAALEAVTKRW